MLRKAQVRKMEEIGREESSDVASLLS